MYRRRRRRPRTGPTSVSIPGVTRRWCRLVSEMSTPTAGTFDATCASPGAPRRCRTRRSSGGFVHPVGHRPSRWDRGWTPPAVSSTPSGGRGRPTASSPRQLVLIENINTPVAKRRKFSSDVSLRHAPEAPEGEGRRRQASSKIARQRDRGEALAAGTRRGGEGAGERHVDRNHFVHGAPEQGKKKVMRSCWVDGRCVNERLMNVFSCTR